MAVSSVASLRTAIHEALTTDRTATHTRAIPSAYLFQRGLPPGLDATLRSTRAKGTPGAFVVIARMTPEPGVGDELGSDHLYRLSIVISRDYWLGYEQRTADIDTVMSRVADDLMRVRAALCFPGALDTTAAGADTGIADNALSPVGDQSVLTVDRIGNGRDRLLNARDAFQCWFLFDPDT